MARIKSTRSGAHQAKLVENQQHEVYWMMKRLLRDKRQLSSQKEKKKKHTVGGGEKYGNKKTWQGEISEYQFSSGVRY